MKKTMILRSLALGIALCLTLALLPVMGANAAAVAGAGFTLDLTITAPIKSAYDVGDVVSVKIMAQNWGTTNFTNITVTAPKLGLTDVISLTAGKIKYYDLTYTVTAADALNGSVRIDTAATGGAADTCGKTLIVNPLPKTQQLGWMRSTEVPEESFTKPITTGTDAWTYSEVFANTPIKYFENEDVRAVANQKAAGGTEVVRPLDQQLVGIRHIWDSGDYFPLYKEQNGNVFYDWASWKHFGINGEVNTTDGEYSIRRFSAYIDLSAQQLTGSVLLAPEDELGNMSYLMPINDNMFVFVNGQLAYWGGTDVIAGGNQYGALTRTAFMGQDGIKVRNGVNGVLKNIYPHTDGWCIDLEENSGAVNIQPLLTTGFNRIDIITDDYWEGGGMNRLDLWFK